MNNRKVAFARAQQIKAEKNNSVMVNQKVNNTIISVPQVKRPRLRTDEIYVDMIENMMDDVEERMISLSRWDGEHSVWKHKDLLDY